MRDSEISQRSQLRSRTDWSSFGRQRYGTAVCPQACWRGQLTPASQTLGTRMLARRLEATFLVGRWEAWEWEEPAVP